MDCQQKAWWDGDKLVGKWSSIPFSLTFCVVLLHGAKLVMRKLSDQQTTTWNELGNDLKAVWTADTNDTSGHTWQHIRLKSCRKSKVPLLKGYTHAEGSNVNTELNKYVGWSFNRFWLLISLFCNMLCSVTRLTAILQVNNNRFLCILCV